jgi:argininosuccinate lyase
LTSNKALWGGRFEQQTETSLQAFGASLPFDRRLWYCDILGSKAHAHMLGAQGIIPATDAQEIADGLDAIAAQIEAGDFVFDLVDEDIHMSIERALTAAIGDAGRRLHTGRSRNDQVATDFRLFCKAQAEALALRVNELRGVLIEVACDHPSVVMPGYTHLQKAQPLLFAHHLLAYYWMLARDFKRLVAAQDAADELPLGSAALAGTSYPLNRRQVADELGFAAVTANSLDAVSNRDFALDLLYACSVTMLHLSRLCEELILWSSSEFGFITLSDAYSTGSSIMPQKKNPDFAELVRGKTGRVFGDLQALLVTLKGLPLAYNKDMQEDKEGVFDAVDTLEASLRAVAGMLATMQVNAETMRAGALGGFMAATDLADFLVAKGMPFRDAHEVVGRIVLQAEKTGRTLQSFSLAELQAFSDVFDAEALAAIDIDKVVARRTTAGGTAPVQVAEQLNQARRQLAADTHLLQGVASATA